MLLIASWVYWYFSCNFLSSGLLFAIFWSSRGHFGIFWKFGGGGLHFVRQSTPLVEFPQSTRGCWEAPSRTAPSRPGLFNGWFSRFFFFGALWMVPVDQEVFHHPQSKILPVDQGHFWNLPVEFSHLYKVGVIFWEVFQLRSSLFRVFVRILWPCQG